MSFESDLIAMANSVTQKVAGKNVYEVSVVLVNIQHYGGLAAARDEALRWSRNVSYVQTDGMSDADAEQSALDSRNEGPADALRHCYLAAMLARDVGYNVALEVLTSHEMDGNWGSLASQMDLHNNAVGLEIGVRMKSASNLDLQQAVLNAFFQGRLLVHDKAKGALVPSKSLTFGR